MTARLARLLLVALLVVGCGSAGADPTVAPAPTPVPATPAVVETSSPWPAEFEKQFCIAVAQVSILTEDMVGIAAAASAGDYEELSLKAYGASGMVFSIDTSLSLAPEWPPAAEAVASWRRALAAIGQALDGLDAAAAARSAGDVQRAAEKLSEATPLMDEARDALTAFRTATDFTC